MSQRVAIVTGAASGIGLSISHLLLEAGYKLGLIDKDPLPASLSEGEKNEAIIFLKGQVYDESLASQLREQVVQRWGRIDALVNNVGKFQKLDLTELSLAQWREIIDTNLTSYFLFAKLCAPHLKQSRGAIVNIASTRALQSEADTEAYAASKGGIVALTHALAISLGPEIRVNCVSPGWIDSRDDATKKREPLRQIDHNQHPVGRVGEPEDVAQMVQWLIQEQRGFVSGQNFIVDGGMTRKMIYVE